MAHGEDGGNGVYSHDTNFPTNSWYGNNYFVDVIFSSAIATAQLTTPVSISGLTYLDLPIDTFGGATTTAQGSISTLSVYDLALQVGGTLTTNNQTHPFNLVGTVYGSTRGALGDKVAKLVDTTTTFDVVYCAIRHEALDTISGTSVSGASLELYLQHRGTRTVTFIDVPLSSGLQSTLGTVLSASLVATAPTAQDYWQNFLFTPAELASRDVDAEYQAYIDSLTPEQLIALREQEENNGMTLLASMQHQYQLELYLKRVENTPEALDLDLATTPTIPELVLELETDYSVRMMGGIGNGSNVLDIKTLGDTGDILLGQHELPTLYGLYAHAGILDREDGAFDVIHARGRTWGVRVDTADFFNHNYDLAQLREVPLATMPQRVDAVEYTRLQIGDPYTIFTLLFSEDKWYCSKLVWAAYMRKAGLDLRFPFIGATFVVPDHLAITPFTNPIATSQ